MLPPERSDDKQPRFNKSSIIISSMIDGGVQWWKIENHQKSCHEILLVVVLPVGLFTINDSWQKSQFRRITAVKHDCKPQLLVVLTFFNQWFKGSSGQWISQKHHYRYHCHYHYCYRYHYHCLPSNRDVRFAFNVSIVITSLASFYLFPISSQTQPATTHNWRRKCLWMSTSQ